MPRHQKQTPWQQVILWTFHGLVAVSIRNVLHLPVATAGNGAFLQMAWSGLGFQTEPPRILGLGGIV